MDDLIFVTEQSFDEFADVYEFSERERAVSTLRDQILFVPSMLSTNCKFIRRAAQFDSSYYMESLVKILKEPVDCDFAKLSQALHCSALSDLLEGSFSLPSFQILL